MLTSFSEHIRNAVPDELANMRRWLLWTAEYIEGAKKPKKVPRYAPTMKPRSGELGGKADLENLVSLDEALHFQAKNSSAGIGFAFVEGDGLVGIDLDNCIDNDGVFSTMADSITNAAKTYTEFSPSGRGIHIIAKGYVEPCKCSKIEVYPYGRFFCFTGRSIAFEGILSNPGEAFFQKLVASVERYKKLDNEERNKKLKSAMTQPIPSLPSSISSDDFQIAKDALAHISASVDNDDWVVVGMALKSKFGEQGFFIWDEWSKTSDKYPGTRELEVRWRSFKREGVTLGSVIAMAKENGYEMPRKARESVQVKTIKTENKEPEKQEAQGEEWPDPIDILGDIKPPPPPLELLPETLGNFIYDESALIGCDPGAMVAACLVACAGAISDEIKLRPKRFHEGWKERACLWGAFVGSAAEKKSPAFSAAMRPLRKIEDRLAEHRVAEQKEYEIALERWKASLKSKKKGQEDYEDARPEQPNKTSYMVNKTTIEAMQDTLANNPRGVVSYFDELASWFGSMDAYAKGASSKDRPEWLELYNGGPKSFKTIARGEVFVPNWSSSLFGGIQPDAIRKISKGLPEDGLMQRFFVICASTGSNKGEDREPHPGVWQRYSDLINWLLTIEANFDEVLTLDDEALAIKNDLYDWSRSMLDHDVLRGGLKSHVGKYEGLYARLLVVWHCVTMFDRGDWKWIVDGQTAKECATFVREYLFRHAVHFYNGILGGSDEEAAAQAVGRTILSIDSDEVNNRILARRCREWRRMKDWEKDAVMKVLDSHGWVTPTELPVGSRLPKSWAINPKIRTAFSHEREKELLRRERAREYIHEAQIRR